MTLQDMMVRYRARNDLTLEQLAEKIGLSKQTVWAIENGKQNPSRVTEEKIKLIVGEQEDENIGIKT